MKFKVMSVMLLALGLMFQIGFADSRFQSGSQDNHFLSNSVVAGQEEIKSIPVTALLEKDTRLKLVDSVIKSHESMIFTKLSIKKVGEGYVIEVPNQYTGTVAVVMEKRDKSLVISSYAKPEKGAFELVKSTEANHLKIPESSLLTLVNIKSKLSGRYTSKRVPLEQTIIATTLQTTCDAVLLSDLKKMSQAAKTDAQIDLQVVSAYRSVKKQSALFHQQLAKYKGLGASKAYAKAVLGVNPPGYSEHHTGLALDVLTKKHITLSSFYGTKAAKWLEDNAHDYGFIIRYPEGKTEVTGIKYEPWHIRYVGKDFAPLLKKTGLTLEEFIEVAKAGTIYRDSDDVVHGLLVVPANTALLNTLVDEEAVKLVRYPINDAWVAVEMILN